jgi:hypothetical protein
LIEGIRGNAKRFRQVLRRAFVRVGLARGNEVVGGVTATAKASGFAAGYATIGDDASLPDKVAFLLRGYGEHEVEFQHVRREFDARLEQVRGDFRDHIAEQINRFRSENIKVRRAGVALVMTGTVLLAVSPFAT